MDHLGPYVALLGRVLLSSIFLISGFLKLVKPSGDAGDMRSKGMPAVGFLLVMAAIVEIGGGFSILLGYQARAGSLALFPCLIPVTLIFYSFWAWAGERKASPDGEPHEKPDYHGRPAAGCGLGDGIIQPRAVACRLRRRQSQQV